MQQRSVVVEVSQLLRKDGGGIGRKRLLSGLGRLRDVHEGIRRGAGEGRWPHLSVVERADVARAEALGVALREAAPRLAVAGQPGAIAALRAIVEPLGGAAPLWVAGPDAVGAVDEGDVAWLCLEGPAWVDALAEEAVERGRRVAVAGPGSHEPPPGGWWIDDVVAGDGRFGGLGPAGLALAAWAGIDVGSLVAGAADVAAACARPALFENPAYTLALTSIFAERDLGAGVCAQLVTASRLEPFARWVVRMWGAVTSAAVPSDGVTRRIGGSGVAGAVGDEELVEALLEGPRDKLVTLWDPLAVDTAVGPYGQHAAVQARALQDLLDRENVPSLRVRLPGLDARSLGGAVLLAQHAALTAAAWQEHDPLALEAVSAWYAALDRARSDVDVGPAIG